MLEMLIMAFHLFYILFIKVILNVFDFSVPLPLVARVSVIMLVQNKIVYILIFFLINQVIWILQQRINLL